MSGTNDTSDWQTAAVVAAAAAAAHHDSVAAGPSPPPAFSAGTGLDSTLAEAGNSSFDIFSNTSTSTPAASASASASAAHDVAGDPALAQSTGSASGPPPKKGRASAASAKAKGKQKESPTVADSSGKADTDEPHVKKRRRVVVACDTCRRKKIRCQGLPNENHTCDNCSTYGYKCTFTFSASGADNSETAGAASGAAAKGRTRGRYEILEAKVDSLLSILREVDPDLASRWESGELGAGAGALTGVKKFGTGKEDPEPSPNNQTEPGSSVLPAPHPDHDHDEYVHADREAASSAQYNSYLNENVFAPSTSQSDLLLDPALSSAQLSHAAHPSHPHASGSGSGSTSAPAHQHRDRRRGKGGPGGDAHASAGLLLHLSQAAVHIQERDQRANKDGPEDDHDHDHDHDHDTVRSSLRKRSGSNPIGGPSHLLPDIEEGRPRFYGKSSTLHFFDALDSRPSSPLIGRGTKDLYQGEKRSVSVGPANDRGADIEKAQRSRSRKVAPARLYPLNSKQWVRLLRQKNLVAVGRDDDLDDPTWFHRYRLPEPQTVASLLSTYFSTFHPLLPVIHRLSLERDLAFGRAEHDTAFRGLVFTLLAIASRLGMSESDKERLAGMGEEERRKELEEQARRSDYYAAGSRMYHQVFAASLVNVQVLLLTATFMHGSIGAGTAWVVLGLAIRALLDIGLHSERANAGFSPFEQELRRRVFWGAYILDCIFAVNMGRPPVLRLDECSVRLPLDVSDDALLAAETGGPIDMTLPKGDQGHSANIMSGFVQMIKLNILVGDVVQTLYVSKFEPPHVRTNQSRQLLSQHPPQEKDMDRLIQGLDAWVAETPPHLKWPNVEPIFKMQAGLITCGTHDIRLYILKPFLQQPGLKAKVFSQCMEHAKELLDCVLKLFEDDSLAGITFIFQQAFWSAATFMITVWHHDNSPSVLATDQHLIEGTLRILFSSDPQFFSTIMHRALRLLQRIAKRAMSEMEPARRARVSAYVEADDLSALSELAPDLARPAYSIQPLPPQFGTGAGALQRVAAAAAGAGVSAGGSRDFLPWWQGEYGQVAGVSQHQQQQQASSTGVDGTPSVVVQNPHIWFPYETTGTTRMNNDSSLPGSSQLPSASAPWTAGTDVMNTFAAAQQQPPTNGIGHGHQQQQHQHQTGGVTANSNVPTSTHFASADTMASLPGGLSYYGAQLSGVGTHTNTNTNTNNNGSGVHVPPAAQGGVFPPTHHHHQQQQQQQQQGFSMSHAQLHAAQTQMAFENSFGDARGIAGMGGPNPTLDDLAWTDYFASFLASLSSENPAGSNGSNQHTGS